MRHALVTVVALLASLAPAVAQVPGNPPLGYVYLGNGPGAPPTFQANPGLLIANNLSDLANAATARSNLGLGSMATQNANAVTITGGAITGMPTPTNAADVATKNYVDSNPAPSLIVHPAGRLATAAALPSNTYANGTGGVGATLTATANAALSVDGTAVATNDRIVVKNEAAAANNGIYTVTNTGSGSAAYVLTRATDANQPGTGSASLIGVGTTVLVSAGSSNAGSSWTVNSPVTTIGTSAINWAQLAAGTVSGVSSLGGMTGVISCGAGLTCSANTLSVTDPFPFAVANCPSGTNGPSGTDATACFQAAINAVGSGTLIIPDTGGAAYCIKSGPLNLTSVFSSFIALAKDATFSACGTDNQLFNINAQDIYFHGMIVEGHGILSTDVANSGYSAVVLGPNCIHCHLDELYVLGGLHSIANNSGEAFFSYIHAYQNYGNAIFYNTGGAFLYRMKFDQGLPSGCALSGIPGSSIPGWQATHGYSCGALVQLGSGGPLLQTMSSGTSGSSAPTVQPYGKTITDGSVTWQLVGPQPYYSVVLDGNTSEVFFEQLDTSGFFASGALAMVNQNSGTTPLYLRCWGCAFGSGFVNSILINAGGEVLISNADIADCFLTSCASVQANSSASGFISIEGSRFYVGDGAAYAFDVAVPYTTLSGNIFSGTLKSPNYFAVYSNVYHTAIGNMMTGSQIRTNPGGDWLNVVGNMCAGFTTNCFSNGGSSSHVQTTGNQ